MDFPAGYIPPFQQPGSTAAPAQDISVYAASSSSPPLAAAELPFAHAAFADGQQISVLSEPDFAKEDSAQPSGDASSRRRGINSSKRAAQNRAAQRAFRLRRERYVTGLEEKARNYDRLEAAYLDMQRENHQLRNRLNKAYSDIAALQTHLASSAPVSPSLAGTIATPFSPATFATSPISGTLAHQHSSSHSSLPQEPTFFIRQLSHQQPHSHFHPHAHHQPQHLAHQQSYQQLRPHQQPQEPLHHAARRSARSDNSSYAFGFTQAVRRSPPRASASPTAHYHPSTTVHSAPLQLHIPQTFATAAATSSVAASAPVSSLVHCSPQSPSGQQYQQQQLTVAAIATPAHLRRESLLHQHADSNSPPQSATTSMPHAALSPIQAFGFSRRLEISHTSTSTQAAFTNPIECATSPSGISWDNTTGVDAPPSATGASPPCRPPAGSETASSCSSTTAAQMLPSVREITMSIGALHPTSPLSDHGPSSHQRLGHDGIAGRADVAAESKRRPW